jgi:hypothetical protein
MKNKQQLSYPERVKARAEALRKLEDGAIALSKARAKMIDQNMNRQCDRWVTATERFVSLGMKYVATLEAEDDKFFESI